MITIISPAKSLDFETKPITDKFTQPEFLEQSERINQKLKKLKADDLVRLMGISSKLATLNVDRNHNWSTPFSPENAKQAILAFNGDVYDGMQAGEFTEAQLNYAQQNIRILSGLYGILKPLDLIQPYRLEMGTKLKFERYSDLYEFWKDRLTKAMNAELEQNDGVLINLASKEYFKVLDSSKIKGDIITPEFKDSKNGSYKIISFYAKKARGLMCRFMAENNISNPEDLKAFDTDGYFFNNDLSKGNTWVFTRG